MVQNSAVKILKFLINDMLDYAQIKAGQFRRSSQNFNIVDTVKEVKEVLNFKAEQLKV